eukprot:scaffold2280_cov430-Prasinococcus_capsulatus_cf.AAC.7
MTGTRPGARESIAIGLDPACTTASQGCLTYGSKSACRPHASLTDPPHSQRIALTVAPLVPRQRHVVQPASVRAPPASAQ